MNKKEILVIVLAFILAIVFANYMMKSNKNIRHTDSKAQVEEVVENSSEFPVEAEIEIPVENGKPAFVKEIKSDAEQVSQDVNILHKEGEASKVEKLMIETTDFGIKKSDETGIVEITREFRAESPAKYSFRGYGVLK